MKSKRQKEMMNFFNAIEFIRKNLYHNMEVQQISILMHVILNEGITLRELEIEVGMHQTSISRNAKELSHYIVEKDGKKEAKGLGLVVNMPNEFNRRKLSVFLTPKGKKVAEQLEEILNA